MGVFLGNLIRIRKSNTSAYANIFIGPNISKNILSSSSVLKKKKTRTIRALNQGYNKHNGSQIIHVKTLAYIKLRDG